MPEDYFRKSLELTKNPAVYLSSPELHGVLAELPGSCSVSLRIDQPDPNSNYQEQVPVFGFTILRISG